MTTRGTQALPLGNAPPAAIENDEAEPGCVPFVGGVVEFLGVVAAIEVVGVGVAEFELGVAADVVDAANAFRLGAVFEERAFDMVVVGENLSSGVARNCVGAEISDETAGEDLGTPRNAAPIATRQMQRAIVVQRCASSRRNPSFVFRPLKRHNSITRSVSARRVGRKPHCRVDR